MMYLECSQSVGTNELAKIWGITRPGAVKRAQAMGIPSQTVKGKGRGGCVIVYPLKTMPDDLRRDVIVNRNGVTAKTESLKLHEFPEKLRQKAYDRVRLLFKLDDWIKHPANRLRPAYQLIESFVTRYNKGQIDKELLARVGKRNMRSIQRWLKIYNDARKDGRNPVAALVPGYGKRKGQTKLSEDEQVAIKNIYLTGSAEGGRQTGLISLGQNRINAAHAYWLYCKFLEAAGRQANASYSTVARFIKRIPFFLKVGLREGETAFNDKVMTHMEIDYSSESMLANDWWTSDGHTLNLFCRNGNGDIVRPTLDAFMDKASRKIMGFSLAETESTELITAALFRSIADNGFTLPVNVHIDNGKAYKNKQSRGDFEKNLEGYYSRLGIKPHFAIPYNAKAKQIERLWGTVDEYFSKAFPTYCGKNVDDKPEILAELLKKAKEHPELVPTMDEVRIRFNSEFMAWYNNKSHSGHGMNGRTPEERWRMEADDLNVIMPEDLFEALLQRYIKTVRRNGIQHLGYYYRDAEMKVTLLLKEKVEIAVDPNNISEIIVYDREGKYLFTAARKERSRFMDEPDVKTLEQYKTNAREKRQITKLRAKAAELTSQRAGRIIMTTAEPEIKELEEKQEEINRLKSPFDPL